MAIVLPDAWVVEVAPDAEQHQKAVTEPSQVRISLSRNACLQVLQEFPETRDPRYQVMELEARIHSTAAQVCWASIAKLGVSPGLAHYITCSRSLTPAATNCSDFLGRELPQLLRLPSAQVDNH